MGIFDFYNKNINENNYFTLIKNGIKIMDNYKELKNNGKYEVLIFNTLIVLRVYEKHKPDNIQLLQKEILNNLISIAPKYNVNFINNELTSFINNRFVFYSNELALIYGGQGYLPGKLYDTFYISPLSSEPNMNLDIIELMPFLQYFTQMTEWLSDKTIELL